MAKEVLLFGCFIFIGSVIVAQELPTARIPEGRQFQYPQPIPDLPDRSSDDDNLCDSIDAQFPRRPCSRLKQAPVLDYLPPYRVAPVIPQAVPRPTFDMALDFYRNPLTNEKQVPELSLAHPDDDVPSQYI